MKEGGIITLIIIGIVLLIVLYFVLKPYVIKHRTINCFTGELGAGKTCEGSKEVVRLYRMNKFINYTIGNKKEHLKTGFVKPFTKLRKKLDLKNI